VLADILLPGSRPGRFGVALFNLSANSFDLIAAQGKTTVMQPTLARLSF
jgi:hypothetical protein